MLTSVNITRLVLIPPPRIKKKKEHPQPRRPRAFVGPACRAVHAWREEWGRDMQDGLDPRSILRVNFFLGLIWRRNAALRDHV